MLRSSDELTIGELSRRNGLAASALRFDESRGLIRASRTPGGPRRYPRAMLRRVVLSLQRCRWLKPADAIAERRSGARYLLGDTPPAARKR
jgi:hypothetical protein